MWSNAVLPVEWAQMRGDDVLKVLLVIAGGFLAVAVLLGLCLLPFLFLRSSVRRRGYSGLLVYLRELPQTPAEKLDAVELTLRGAVICGLGLLFPPFVLIGLVPLYYGARKLAAMKLGIKGTEEDTQESWSQ